MGLPISLLRPVRTEGELPADIDVGVVSSDSIATYRNPLKELMGVLLNDRPVLLGTRFPLICIATEILRDGRIFRDKAPLQACRETSPAAPPQTGVLDHLDDRIRVHLKGLFQGLIPAVVKIRRYLKRVRGIN